MVQIVHLSEDNAADAARLSAECLHEAWSEGSLLAQLVSPYDHTLVAVEDGSSVGLLVCRCIQGEAEINSVCVHPGYRRKGIARQMFAQLFDELCDAERFVLEVRSRNEAAVALYEKEGFVCAGLRKGFYDGPADDALIMVKQLSG